LDSWIRVWFEVNPGLVKEGIKIDDIFDILFDPIELPNNKGAERGIFQAEAA
jgi:hypothetical protein